MRRARRPLVGETHNLVGEMRAVPCGHREPREWDLPSEGVPDFTDSAISSALASRSRRDELLLERMALRHFFEAALAQWRQALQLYRQQVQRRSWPTFLDSRHRMGDE